jgi:tripartite-type tricarboxylate transporter receptor subunit TctC
LTGNIGAALITCRFTRLFQTHGSLMNIQGLVLGISVLMFSNAAHADGFPDRAVTNVVPLSTGSASDALARIVGQALSDNWKVPVIVENRPGANGIPATSRVVHSAPDGYTLLTIGSNHVINASLYNDLPYDSIKDVTPIVRIGFTPLILCTTPSLPVSNLRELIALAKSKPKSLTYGSAGVGSPTHLAGEMLKSMAGIDVLHVPYKAVSQAQTDLMAGQIDMQFMVPSVAIPQIKAGRYRGIAVGEPNRIPDMPDLPTLDEAGLPGFAANSWVGIVGPANLPIGIVKKISDDVLKALASPEIQNQISSAGFVVAAMPPEKFGEFMRVDQARMAEIVKQSGAKASQ